MMSFVEFWWLVFVATIKFASLIVVGYSIIFAVLYPTLGGLLWFTRRVWRATDKATRFIPAIVLAVLLSGTAISQAQVVCSIPCPVVNFEANLQNGIIGDVMLAMNLVKQSQSEILYKMGLRLSYFTSMSKYSVDRDTMPEWKIHNYFTDDVLYAKPFNYSLSYGDTSGDGYRQVAVPRSPEGAVMGGLPPNATDAMKAQMGLIEWADSTIIRGTDMTGKHRFNGRDEADSIIAMDANVSDDDKEQSLAAVLDKVAGSALVQAHNRQTSNEIKAAILEQLLLENGWDRDSDAEEMNHLLAQLKWAQENAGKPSPIVENAGSTLRNWRLP